MRRHRPVAAAGPGVLCAPLLRCSGIARDLRSGVVVMAGRPPPRSAMPPCGRGKLGAEGKLYFCPILDLGVASDNELHCLSCPPHPGRPIPTRMSTLQMSENFPVHFLRGRLAVGARVWSAALEPSLIFRPVSRRRASGPGLTGNLPAHAKWKGNGCSSKCDSRALTPAPLSLKIFLIMKSSRFLPCLVAALAVFMPWTVLAQSAPTISAQPVAAAVVPAGGTLNLQVTAAGTSPLTYQWRKGTSNLPGATNASYTKTGFAVADAGTYDVVVTANAVSTTSSSAAVTLAPAGGTLVSDPNFVRPDFKQDAFAGRVTVDSTGRVYATWTNGNFISGLGNQQRGAVIRLNADGTLDNTFHLGAALVDAWAISLQADGRILVGGIASNESGETGYALPRVFRFNPDGTRDQSYQSPHFTSVPRFMTLQSDGRLLVVPSSNTSANGGIPVMARLNADGSLDSTFAQPTLNAGGSIFLPPVVDGAGNIYVGGIFNTINGAGRPALARLLPTGALDPGWVPNGFTLAGTGQIRGLGLQTQGANAGKLLVAGGSLTVAGSAAPTANRPVIRLLSNGALDSSFTLVTQADAGMVPRPRLLNVLPDDRFYVVGATVARFLADGVVDSSYTHPAFSTEFFWMDTMADGRVVVPPEAGSTINGNAAPSLVRLTATGAVDSAFTAGAFNREIYPGRFAAVADSKVLTWGNFDRVKGVSRPGIVRLNPTGAIDNSFNVSGVTNLRYVAFAEVGSDGSILASTRTGINPAALTSGVVRLQANGAIDPTFALDATLAGRVDGMEVKLLPDNQVAVWSLTPQGMISDSNFLRRLGPNGTIDPSFAPSGTGDFGAVYRAGTGAITSLTLGAFRVLAIDSVGRLIARGTTGAYPAGAGTLSYTLLRFNANGALDPTFTAPLVAWSTSVTFPTVTDAQTNGGAPGQITANVVFGAPFTGATPLADGKMLVYGMFATLGGQPTPGLARLTSTGTVDTTFSVGSGAQLRYHAGRSAQVEGVTVAADGKLWVTGAFDTFNGVAAPGLVRLNADGSVDLGFATDIAYRPYLGGLTQVSFAPNGTLYVGGTYARAGDTFPSAFQALISVPVLSQMFFGADDFNSGSDAKWAYFFRLAGAAGNGNLAFTNQRLDFSKGAGAGSYFLGWDGTPGDPSGDRNSASYSASWHTDLRVTNTAAVSANEFSTVGFEVAANNGQYVGVMLEYFAGTPFLRSELKDKNNVITPLQVPATGTGDVWLRLSWDTANQVLRTWYSYDGVNFVSLAIYDPVNSWTSGAVNSGFHFEIFGNSNAASAIVGGAMYADNFSINAPPVIGTQPVASLSVTAGGSIVLSVTASGPSPLAYQWRKGGFAIAGATSANLTIPNATVSDAGTYDVVVITPAGSTTSRPAHVGVAPTSYPGQIAADPTWDPNPLTISTRTFAAVKLPGGKYLVGGESVRWDNQPRTALARLNADLTLDNTWTPPLINGVIYALALAPDGTVYFGGDFTAVDGHLRSGLARLLGPNLVHDLTWRSGESLPSVAPTQVSALAVQDNNQVLVARQCFVAGNITGTNVLRRLNLDGAVDSTFSVNITLSAGSRLHSLMAEPGANPAIAFAGSFSAVNGTARGGVARIDATGATLDPGFGGTGGNSSVNFLTRLSDGRYVVGGNFTTFNGLARNRVAVLTAATGTVDPTFAPILTGTTIGQAHGATVLSDGRILVFGNFTLYAGNNTAGFVRLNGTTGAFDSALTVGAGAQAGGFNISGAGRNLFAYTLAGDQVALIGTFNQLLGQRRVAVAIINAGVSNADASDPTKTLAAVPATLALRPAFTGAAFLEKNGQLTVFGSADIAGSTPGLGQILRVNPNGSLDPTFPGGVGFGLNGLSTFGIYRATRQGDGKYVAIGDFGSYNGVTANRLVRLNPNGSIDSSFNVGTGPSNFIVTPLALANGRVVLFGSFGSGFTYNGTTVTGNILRLNADGSRDTTFNGVVQGFNAAPAFVLENPNHEDPAEADGILVAGPFTTYNNVPVPGLVALKSDGSIDPAFTYGGVGPAGGSITGMTLLAADRLALFGSFTSFNGVAVNHLAILKGDPLVLDPAFTAPSAVDASVNQIIAQEDGKFIVVGDFSSGPALRLTAAGAVDSSFGLRGLTNFPGGGVGARFILADDGSLYLHNTMVSLDYGPARGLARFRGAVTPPTIAVGPATGTLQLGVNNVLSVRAAGTAPYTYQWSNGAGPISGATDSVLVIPNATAGDAGSYTVAVTGPGGSITSAAAVLNVVTTVAIQDQPISRRATAGAKVLFRVSATTTVGGATLTYQWRKDGAPISGATAADLTLMGVSAGDAGTYSVVVGDGSGTITSANAVLTVLPADPVLWQQFTEWSSEQAPSRTIHDGAGKVYVPWSVYDRNPDMVAGRVVGALARFNEAEGSLDSTFKLDRRYRRAAHAAVQPDGRVLVAVTAGDSDTVIRVSSNGALDATYNAPLFARGIRFITRQGDGKVLVASVGEVDPNAPGGALGAAAPGVYRLNADGSLDGGFTVAALNSYGVIFGAPELDGAGRIYLAGGFNTINGVSRASMARLNANGTLDTAYANPADPASLPAGFITSQVRGVSFQSDGRAIFVGGFRYTGRGTSGDQIMAVRFSTAGALDATFGMPLRSQLGLGPNGVRLRYLVLQSDDKIVAVSDRLVRLNADGTVDSSFVSRAFGKETFWVSKGSDGRFYVPDVNTVAGQSITQPLWGNGIACFAPGGVLEQSFQTGGWGRSALVDDGVVLSDGRVWVAGNFNRYGARVVPGLAQFAANGSLAPNQPASTSTMTAAVATAAGNDKIFAVVRISENVGEVSTPALTRLNADATADGTFAAVLPAGYSLGSARLFAAPGGKVILAQNNITPEAAVNGSAGDALVRLNANGSRDPAFNPTASSFAVVERGAGNVITMIRTGGVGVGQVLTDGRSIIGIVGVDGSFRVQRLLDNGSVDTSFAAPSFGTVTPSVGFTSNITDPLNPTAPPTQYNLSIYDGGELLRATHQIADGRVYVGGRFALAGSPRGLVRLQANGTLDATFTGAGIAYAKTDAGPYVTSITSDSLGRVYVAGRFDSFNGHAVPAGLFRLNPDGSFDAGWISPLAVFDAPRAEARLVVVGAKLYAFGTVALAGDTLPVAYRAVDIPPPPSITTSPVAATAVAGGSASFTVVAGGPGPFTYQWLKNTTPLGGATQATLTLGTVSAADNADYAVVVSGPGGSTTTAPVAFALTVAPSFTVHPRSLSVVLGESFSLSGKLAGTPPFTYQWKHGNTDIPGATNATYAVAVAVAGDAGSYTLVGTNPAGNATSNPADIAFITAGVAAGTHAVVGTGYVAGGTVTITNTLGFTGTASSLGWDLLLPPGWSFASDGGSAGETKPNVGDTGTLGWAWNTPQTGPVTFTYTLNVPAGQTGDQSLIAIAIVRPGALQVLAKPDPLVVHQVAAHDADTDHNFRISLLELTRMIELYNARNGTTRTGCYKVDVAGEDGFNPEPTRASSAVVTLTRYHSADSDRNGKISLLELTRVIELYNTRSGTIRTGAYHAQGGTEDGFAPGP